MMNIDLIRHGLEFARAIDNHQYEVTDRGLLFPKQKAMIGGVFDTWINGADHQVDPNILPAEGLAEILKSGMGGTAWYIAPFTNNVTPLSTLTAATFTGVLAEFTTYDEAARVAYTIPADPTAGSYSNSASLASFTVGAVGGAGQAIYGAGILSASAKSATTGTLLCASKFSGARTVYEDDVLNVQYTINATST